MKKICLFFISIFATVNLSYAQISDGTLPLSFGKFFNEKLNTPSITMPGFDVDAMIAEDQTRELNKAVPYRFGHNFFVSYSLNNSGSWVNLPNGGRVWTLRIFSPNAKTLNLAYNDFYIPQGAKLWLYNDDRSDVIGAFTSANNSSDKLFATDVTLGSAITIEYYEPAEQIGKGSLTVFRVTHGYRGFEKFAKQFGDAGSCNVNIMCPDGDDWQIQKRSVAFYLNGSGNEICSGALINNTANDGTPYFLSANHCYSSISSTLSTMVFKFNFEAPTCTYTGSTPTHKSMVGATLKARDAGSDFLLLQLNTTPPSSYNPFYSGWNRAGSVSGAVTGIHHPAGDVKKISFAPSVTSASYSGADCWKTGTWGQGVTEGGSSGSPLYDDNKRIIGQLYGGPSSCFASGTSRIDYYGRVETSWNGGGTSATRLKDWLDPSSSNVTEIDGFDPNAVVPTLNLDATVSSVLSPVDGSSQCAGSILPQIKIKNLGINTLTSLTLTYLVSPAGNPVVFNWTGSLATNASTTVSLPQIDNLTAGTYTINFTSSLPNGSADENTTNDTRNVSFEIVSATETTTSQNFESTTFPINNWTVNDPDNMGTWERVTNASGFGNSAACLKMDNYNGVNGQSDFLYSPLLSFTDLAAPIELSFELAYAKYSNFYCDSLRILISIDCGATWQAMLAKGRFTGLPTVVNNVTTEFVPSASEWRNELISLDAYAGENNVKIAFENLSKNGNNLYLDNINITGSSASTVGLKQNKTNEDITIYPNPTENVLTVSTAISSSGTIEIYSVIGSLQKTINYTNEKDITVNVSELSKGIYFVKVNSNGITTTNKFLKN